MALHLFPSKQNRSVQRHQSHSKNERMSSTTPTLSGSIFISPVAGVLDSGEWGEFRLPLLSPCIKKLKITLTLSEKSQELCPLRCESFFPVQSEMCV